MGILVQTDLALGMIDDAFRCLLRCCHSGKDPQCVQITVQWLRVDLERIISNIFDELFDRYRNDILDDLILLPVMLNFLQYYRVFLWIYLIEAFYNLELFTEVGVLFYVYWSNETEKEMILHLRFVPKESVFFFDEATSLFSLILFL